MSVKTVERVGTGEPSTSSSCSTEEDHIPESIREIFDDDPNKFFQVYYLNEHSQIMVKNQWLFEGREKTYVDFAYAEISGTCTHVVVTFQGRTSFHENMSGATNSDIEVGEKIQIRIDGRRIP